MFMFTLELCMGHDAACLPVDLNPHCILNVISLMWIQSSDRMPNKVASFKWYIWSTMGRHSTFSYWYSQEVIQSWLFVGRDLTRHIPRIIVRNGSISTNWSHQLCCMQWNVDEIRLVYIMDKDADMHDFSPGTQRYHMTLLELARLSMLVEAFIQTTYFNWRK